MSHIIETERLRLVPVNPRHIAAFFRSRAELASMLGAAVPDDWPVCPEGMGYWRERAEELEKAPGWAGYFFMHKADDKVVGDGGFKGPPNAEGAVEMGYALIPDYRRRGLATEAARALMDWAFTHPEVNSVTAETLADGRESMRLLDGLGMTFQEARTDRGEVEVYLWAISREEYNTPRKPPETQGCPF